MNDSVVILARSLPIHNMGGMEVVCWDLCCSLAKHGLTVYVVTTPYPKGKNLTKVPEGIELCILDKTKHHIEANSDKGGQQCADPQRRKIRCHPHVGNRRPGGVAEKAWL